MIVRPQVKLLLLIAVVLIIVAFVYMDTRSKGGIVTVGESERWARWPEKSGNSAPGTGAYIDNPAELYRTGFALEDISKKLLEQRNNLSRILNLKQQKLGQLECEVRINNVLLLCFCTNAHCSCTMLLFLHHLQTCNSINMLYARVLSHYSSVLQDSYFL